MKNVHLRKPTTMYVSGILPKYKVTMAEEKHKSKKIEKKITNPVGNTT